MASVSKDTDGEFIAYLGPVASYTYQAALDYFSPAKANSFRPHHTIEDVFQAVQSGSAPYGIVPFENSTNGSVVLSLDLFADVGNSHPDIEVCGEVYVDVHHCLVGFAPPTLSVPISISPSTSGDTTPTSTTPFPIRPRSKLKVSIKHIQKIYSHPQAWGQCSTFLSSYLKGLEMQDVSSTSRAAELVASDPTRTTAAISSMVAANVHGLNILAEGIEDRSNNSTRFFVICKGNSLSKSQKTPIAPIDPYEESRRFKTLLSFTVDHDNPGALANALSVFNQYGLNLTSINARPSGLVPWNYIFLIEIRGRRDGTHDGPVNAALRDLTNVVKLWRWLGSWENQMPPQEC